MLGWDLTSKILWAAMGLRVSMGLKVVIPGSPTTMLCLMQITPVQEWEEA